MKTYFRLLSFSKPYSSYVPQYTVLIIFAIIFGVVNFSLIIPLLNVLFGTFDVNASLVKPEFNFSIDYLKNIFNYYFNKTIVDHGKVGALNYVCVIIVICVFLANFFRYFAQRVLSNMRTNLVKQMRKELFDKLSTLPLGYYHNQQKGDLMSVISNDVSEIENSVVTSVQVMFREPLLIIAYFILLFSMSVELTIFTMIFLPVSGGIIGTISKQLKRQATKGQKVLGKILSITDEAITGTRIIKGFNAQKHVQQNFETENENYAKVNLSILNKRELASPLSEFLGVFAVVCVLVYGGRLVLQNESDLTASEFITYIILYSQILPPAKSISSSITNVQRGLAAGERVLGIIDTPGEVVDLPSAKAIKDFKSNIKYHNVTFAYDKTDVLKNVNLTIQKGKLIALVGQSGSGKSTLADLLPRFYDIAHGSITLDDENLKSYTLQDLRSLMGIVTQESILFNDTVFGNIAFGMKDAKEEDVIAAAKIANAHEFIIQMENGYHTKIGDRGSKLSGGQKQRLSIARAVLKNPPILILDEATSALDTESERLVQDALSKLMKNRTSIVIAHRLSTIQHADEILVMSQGEIIERGTHLDLLNANGTYKKLFNMQSFV